MGFPIERYCFRNGWRWLLICLILGHYRWDGNQWGPVGFWVNKHFLLRRQIESAEAVWTEGGIKKKKSLAQVVHREHPGDSFSTYCGLSKKPNRAHEVQLLVNSN